MSEPTGGAPETAQFTPDYRLDITGYVCPMTYVKTRLQLEGMEEGERLGLKIRLGESYNNVTRSLNDDEAVRPVGRRLDIGRLGKGDVGKGIFRLQRLRPHLPRRGESE